MSESRKCAKSNDSRFASASASTRHGFGGLGGGGGGGGENLFVGSFSSLSAESTTGTRHGVVIETEHTRRVACVVFLLFVEAEDIDEYQLRNDYGGEDNFSETTSESTRYDEKSPKSSISESSRSS